MSPEITMLVLLLICLLIIKRNCAPIVVEESPTPTPIKRTRKTQPKPRAPRKLRTVYLNSPEREGTNDYSGDY